MSPNRVPEKRVGTALILIGGFSLILYMMNSAVTKTADPITFFVIAFIMMLGVGLRRRFKDWGAPPPPPSMPKPSAPSAPAAKGGGISLPFGKKPAPPASAPPNRQPPPPIPAKPKSFLGKLDDAMRPKNKK